MIYPGIPLEQWLEKYPALKLKDDKPLCECGEEHHRAFVTQKSVGIQCSKCNSGTWIRKDQEFTNLILNILDNLEE